MMSLRATSPDTGNLMQPDYASSVLTPLSIDGVAYFTAAQVAREAGVTRQTLWRWRQDGKVPTGRRYRDRQILYTHAELQRVRDYAHRIELLEPPIPENADQLGLFSRPSKKGSSR